MKAIIYVYAETVSEHPAFTIFCFPSSLSERTASGFSDG